MLWIVAHSRPEPPGICDISSGDNFLVLFGCACGGEQVAGQLLADELVIRQVLVHGFDDPIPVLVHLRNWIIRVVPRCVGIPNDIKPVPAPPLTVLWRGE